MRAIWTGTVNFGLINIPVKLYKGTESKNLDFDYLHKKDLSKIRYAKICKKEEKEIQYNEIVRGFEYRDGDYIVVTNEDLKKASPEKTKSVQILSFTNADEVDTEYFDTPYYVEPQKNSEKAYHLLLKALEQTGKVGIASFILRSRESLAVLKPNSDIIVLNKLRYSNEIRNYDELNLTTDQKVTSAEMDMAKYLIEKLTKKFNPQEYKDTYKEKLEKLIEKKAKGEEFHSEEAEKQPTKVEDLMSLLKQSIEEERRAAI